MALLANRRHHRRSRHRRRRHYQAKDFSFPFNALCGGPSPSGLAFDWAVAGVVLASELRLHISGN